MIETPKMTLDQLLAFGDVPTDLKNSFKRFHEMMEELSTLTDQENDHLMRAKKVSGKEISVRKVVLLELFERQAQKIFETLKSECPNHHALQNYFILLIQTLQNKLRVNTSLQLDAMKQLKEKQHVSDVRSCTDLDTTKDAADGGKGEPLCH
jgi:flagellar biosynthesis/type III secretory pathway chaperone